MVKLINSCILYCNDSDTVGSRIQIGKKAHFLALAEMAIEKFDFAACRVPGQGFLMVPDLIPYVSAGVGKRSSDPNDYVTRVHRGRVDCYLKRKFAAPTEGVGLVVYTTEAYLNDPEVEESEADRVADCSHVLVAILGFAGPKSLLSLYRFVHNLAGGNKEAALWTADEIRQKACEIIAYDDEWCIVSD